MIESIDWLVSKDNEDTINSEKSYMTDYTKNHFQNNVKACNRVILSGFGISIHEEGDYTKESSYCVSNKSNCCKNEQLLNLKAPLKIGLEVFEA